MDVPVDSSGLKVTHKAASNGRGLDLITSSFVFSSHSLILLDLSDTTEKQKIVTDRHDPSQSSATGLSRLI